MVFKIILENRNKEEATKLAGSIHNILAGNKDYVDSNIVLNIDDPKECYLYLDASVTEDIPRAVKSIHESLEKFIDSL